MCLTPDVWAAPVRLCGSDLLGDSFARSVAEFTRRNGGTLQLDLRGTRPGLEALRTGRADAGLLFLPPGESPPAEQFFVWPVAWEAVVVIVPRASPLTRVTLEQLAEVFGVSAARPTGTGLTPAAPLPQVLALPTDLTLPLFRRVVLKDAALKPEIDSSETPAQFFVRLGASANTLGLAPSRTVVLAGFRVLPVAAGRDEPAREPAPESIERGDYPLCMPLQLVFRRQAVPHISDLVRFLLSEEGVRALESAGLVPLPSGARQQRLFDLERL